MSASAPHIPVLRAGVEYESLDTIEVRPAAGGEPLAIVSQANAGIIKRDLKRLDDKAASLRALSTERMLEICKDAGQLFLHGDVSLSDDGPAWSPEDYVNTLSQTSGLPHALCRRNMQKVFTVFDSMGEILRGLMRGLDPGVLDTGFGEHCGIALHYSNPVNALGVVLPSNSPGVNSIWIPSIALRVPVVLKPGREEPWTPLRIMRALILAGCPREAFSFYPTDHEGAAAVLEHSNRSLLFGDAAVTKAYSRDPRVQIHGPGRSKVLIGADAIEDWREYLPVLVDSVAANGGRSCINASSIFVPSHGAEIADALAQELASYVPVPADDEHAKLSAFANPKFAEFIDASIESGLDEGGATDVTAKHREGPRTATHDGAQYLLPTVVHCESLEHSLARSEYMFPFTSVVEVPHDELVDSLGPSLVVTAITRDADLVEKLRRSDHVDRLNLGPVPTSHVEWDQPHEGNLFEFLYERRAIQCADGWATH